MLKKKRRKTACNTLSNHRLTALELIIRTARHTSAQRFIVNRYLPSQNYHSLDRLHLLDIGLAQL